MIHTACELHKANAANFSLVLIVNSSEHGECHQYRFTREFRAMDVSDVEGLKLTLEHQKVDFLYTAASDVIEMATGCDDFKLDETLADECEEGRDYTELLEAQICDTEMLLIYSNEAREIIIKTISGGHQICGYTHVEAL